MNSKNGKWSKKYDKCIQCDSTESRYMGKGLCKLCYLKQYREDPKNQDRINASKRKFYVEKVIPERTKAIREEKYFDSKRDLVLQRDGHKCVKCQSDKLLVVHHIDRSGRGKRAGHNNDLSNLETLCRRCHVNEHRQELLEARMSKQ